MVGLLLLNESVLGHNFDCIAFACFVMSGMADTSPSTFTNSSSKFDVIEFDAKDTKSEMMQFKLTYLSSSIESLLK